MSSGARAWVLGWCVAVVAGAVGCSSSREVRPPRLARVVRLPGRADKLVVGSRGRLYYTVSAYGPQARASEIRVAEANGSPGQSIELAAGVEVKALAADGRGTLYVGVSEGGKAQVWVFPERGGEAEPKAKLEPELPDELHALLVGRRPGTLVALCGESWVVTLKTDGSVARQVELPGDGKPEGGGAGPQGNVYLRRGSGPVAKVTPEGAVDAGWAKSAAAAHDYVRSVAVDSRGLVYVAASDGEIYLRAYSGEGELAFNVVAEGLTHAPDRLVVTPDDWVYAVQGEKVYVFKP